MDDIIQLKITLRGTNPPIWRRILVDKSISFFELHHIIQRTMGWDNCHLFEFNIDNYRMGNLIGDPEYDHGLIDASTVTIDSIINDTKEKFVYNYDFGDSWQHQILVENILPRDGKTKYPTCIDGKLNCPPEDCGGIPGFYNLLDIIGNKRHPERKEMLEWLGGHYDPEHFDKKTINKTLENTVTKSTKRTTRQ